MIERIPSGSRAIDNFLKGGFPLRSVSIIYGEAETGKTTLAIQCAAACAVKGHKTLFVDCDRTFSAQRLSQIIHEQTSDAAELIVLARPNDFNEQITIVDHMTEYINQTFRLVVFDTITSLYRLRISESPSRTFELNREINRQLAIAAQTAKTHNVAFLMTSQVHTVFNDSPVSIEPVATRVLKFWGDIVLSLKPTEISQVVRATVEKNPENLPPPSFDLKIEENGMRDYSLR